MIILGIDPGSVKAGYGIIKVEGKQTQLIEAGVLRFDSDEALIDRLFPIFSAAKQLVEKFNPDVIALETLIYTKSVPSLAKLAQARGALICGFGETYRSKIFEYAPTLVKSTVTGHGQATKEGVEKTLRLIFGKSIEFATHDASDALAIALCHSLHGGKIGATKKSSSTKSRSLKSVFADYRGK